MLAACFLLSIATLSGTLLTAVYDHSAPLPARLCMGATTGMVLLSMIGFVTASLMGLNPAYIAVASIIVLLPLLLLFRSTYREQWTLNIRAAANAVKHTLQQHRWSAAGYLLFYGGIAVLLGMAFERAVYATADGIFTGARNNLGDLTLHVQVISSFTQGNNLPPQDPTYTGVRFAYPFLVDFLTGMLVRAGAGMITAMWMQNMALILALTGLIHYWTLLLTRNRLAGLIAPALVLFSGGLGWTWILQEVHASTDGLLPMLAHLSHDYTIMDAPGILRWGNSVTTLFIPQRSILLGMPLAICIFCLWWKAVGASPEYQGATSRHDASQRLMIAAGIFAGLLPLTHAHTFLVVMAVAACLTLIFRSAWRNWAIFFASATLVALPQIIWLAGAGGVKLQSYLQWQAGWDHGIFNPALFWLINTGLFIPVLLLSLFWPRVGLALPRRVFVFYAPFLLCFIVPNAVRLSPWVWDNIKVLIYWYVASTPLVAWLLANWLKQKSRWRWAAAGVMATMLLSGCLDIFRIASGQMEYQEWDRDGIGTARVISESAAPQAVVLHAPTYNSPVFLTGRRSLLGYPGWVASRGLDFHQRQSDIQRMYAGASDAESLLRRYHVDYVLVGPEEMVAQKANPLFWSKFPKVAEVGDYRLYKTNISEERGPK